MCSVQESVIIVSTRSDWSEIAWFLFLGLLFVFASIRSGSVVLQSVWKEVFVWNLKKSQLHPRESDIRRLEVCMIFLNKIIFKNFCITIVLGRSTCRYWSMYSYEPSQPYSTTPYESTSYFHLSISILDDHQLHSALITLCSCISY